MGRFQPPVRVDHESAAATMRAAARQALAPDEAPVSVWSSSLTRCAEPARRLALAGGLPHRLDARLLELSYGVWEGRSWEALEREDGARLSAWMAAWREAAPPDGESVMELESRVRAWWSELSDGTHLLVAHAGVVRALRVIVADESWENAMATPVPHLRAELFEGSTAG